MGRTRIAVLLSVLVAVGVAGSLQADGARAKGLAAAVSLAPAPFVESVAPEGLGGLVSWAPDTASTEVSTYSVQVLAAPGTKLPAGCSAVTVSVTSSNTAAVVGGLCAGAAYVARVSAVNAAGQGAWSTLSNPFAPYPAQAPGMPLVTSVLGRQQSLVVSWSPPASTGGVALSGYVVKATAGTSTVSASVGASATSATLSGLTNGTTYAVSVLAQNSVGSSPAGSGSGVPAAAYTPRAPEQVSAVPSGTGAIDLSWQAPTNDGGAAVSSYRVTYEEVVQNTSGQWVAAPEAKPVTVSAPSSETSLVVSGLTPSNAFWAFSVAAVNSVDVGPSGSAGQPVSPLTATTSTAVVLAAGTMTALSSDENGQLTWATPVPAQVTALKVGQVLVAAPVPAAPQGLLDTVESVTKTGSGSYVIGIAQAALSEAFSGLSVASAVNPLTTEAGAQSFHASLPGVRLLARSQVGVSFSRELVLSIQYGSGPFKVTGELDVTPNVAIDIALTHGFLGVPNGGVVTAAASVAVKAALVATLQGSLSRKIGEIDGAPEDFQIGPVPVIVVPKIPIYLNASGQISTQVSASIQIGAQASWSSHTPGTLSVKNISTPLTVSGNPLENLSASASVGFSEQPQLDLYDASGPNFEASESLQATINPTPQAGQNYFSLSPALDLKAGWDIDLLSFHASLEAQIAHLSFPAFVIAKPPGAFLTVSPANPAVPVGTSQQLKATRSDGQSFPVTWTVLGGAGDTISSSGLLQPVAPSGRTLTVLATDSTGAAGETTVTVGKPFTAPQKLEVLSAHDGRSATLNWQPPSSTGGAEVSSYTIVTDPLTATQTVPASSNSASLTGLTPGVTYVASVYATNASGLRSMPATISFTPTVTCSITWTGAASTSWSVPSNWDLNRLPNSGDLVCISSATVNLAAATTVYGLTLQGAVLKTSGAITATDLISLEGGTLEGTGGPSVSLSSGGTLGISDGNLSGVHLINHGLATVASASNVTVEQGATLENASNMTIGVGSTVDWDGIAGGQLLNDAGAILKYPSGIESAAVYAPVRNNGAITAGAGTTLMFNGAVSQSSTGSFTGAGTVLLQSTFSPVGSGVSLSDATVAGSIVGPGLVTVPAGGALKMTAGSSLSGVELVNRGTVALGPGPASTSIEGLTKLENIGTLTLADGVSIGWDGTPGGHVVNAAGATLSYPGGGEGAAIYAPVSNNGAITAAFGTLMLDAPVLQSGTGSFAGAGTIVLQSSFAPVGSGVNLSDVTVAGAITGPGVVTVPGGGAVSMTAGASLSGVDFINRGAVTIGSGPANIAIDGATTLENAGSLTIDDGAAIGWDGTAGAHLVNDAGATVSYPGGGEGAAIYAPVRNSGAIVAVSGQLTLTARVLQTSSGSFSGNGLVVLQSTFSPVGSGVSLADATVEGALVGPGTVTVPTGGSVDMAAGSSLSGIRFVNKGTVSIGPGFGYVEIEGASTFENAGLLAVADGAGIDWDGNGDGQLINESGATLAYPGGSGGAALYVPFDNHGAVTVGSGSLYVAYGNTQEGSDTGSYSAAAGGAVDFGGGLRVLGNTFSFAGPGQFEVSGASIAVPGSVSISNLAVNSSGELTGPGTITVPGGGELSLASDAYMTNGVTLINDGAATLQSSGSVSIQGGSTLENAGTLQLADDSSIDGQYAPEAGELVNEPNASIAYEGGTAGAYIDVSFDNYGSVAASVGTRGGTLHIGAGNTTSASDTGSYSAVAGGVIDFAGGERVLGSTFSFTGPGQLAVSGGVVFVPGAATISNLALVGTGDLAGPGSVTVPSGGRLALGEGAYLSRGLTLINNGTGTVQVGNAVHVVGAATLENAGTLQFADGAMMSYDYSPDSGQLVNEPKGTISYAGGTEGAVIDVPFDNYGTVTAAVGTRGGTLYVQAGGTIGASDTGRYNASAGGKIEFNGGERVLGSTFAFAGPGQLAVAGGALAVPGAASISNLAVTGSGRLIGPGTLTVPKGGLLALGASAYLSGRVTLVNGGTGIAQAGNSLEIESGSTLTNTGTLQLADGAAISYFSSPVTGQLINAAGATIKYTGGTQGASIAVPFNNYGTVAASVGSSGGTLYIYGGSGAGVSDVGVYSASTGGTIDFAGGKRTLASSATLSGSGSIELGGATVTDSAVANGAALLLQSGRMVVTPQASGKWSSLVENAGATLQMDVSAATPAAEPARLAVTGAAALGGTLVLQPAAGFVPTEGEVLYLLGWGSVTGQFASVQYPAGLVNYTVTAAAKALTATGIMEG